MIEVLPEIRKLIASDEPVAVSTIIRTWKSAPRPAGSSMLVSQSGEVTGSLSGGCVEGAVYEVAQAVIATGESSLNSYGVSDDDAFSVGLTCGGTIEVFTEVITAQSDWVGELIRERGKDDGFAVATVVRGAARVGTHLVLDASHFVGSTGSARLDEAIFDDARGMLAAGTTGLLSYGLDGQRLESELDVFVNSFAPKARMIIFGAIDFAAALCRLGKFLDYHVTVCDARPVFATQKRFPDADEVVVDWPHRYLASQEIDARTVLAVLTHDPKFDVPVLKVALDSAAGYIGAMGSRRTHVDRLARLRAEGVTEEALARLHSPIGLDLGARTPEETALSIGAEIVQYRWGGSGNQLRNSEGAIHL